MNKLQKLSTTQNLSWISSLNGDPENDKYVPNHKSREVKSGHYVNVLPTPLSEPYLVAYSFDMVNVLELDISTFKSNEFIKLFSGNVGIYNIGDRSWATPYALSIYGQEMYDNCPFKNGNGYGDGRAISLTEVVIKNKRWELQLKGAGKTPFCRDGDGRAVLRSCIREFLASEAMYHLNVDTTRALSVIASRIERVPRQWYSKEGHSIIENSICAMLCRVASSFIRIGHIELYGRRARHAGHIKHTNDINNINELKLMVQHAITREFPHLNKVVDEQERIINFLNESGNKIANLTANWARVGFNQGNFNSDNCHISGQTLDYGPFGFIESFDPKWNMWIDGGLHFAFNNQHIAGNKNFGSLIDAVIPLLNKKNQEIAMTLKQKQLERAINAINLTWANKLGFKDYNSNNATLINEVLELMEIYKVDFTLFWRQLAEIVLHLSDEFLLKNDEVEDDNFGIAISDIDNSNTTIQYAHLFKYLKNCFYHKLSSNDMHKWIQWMLKWISLIKNYYNERDHSFKSISKDMKKISPKFVPREWMLKDAYEKANIGDFSIINELQLLFESPYDEHHGLMTEKYYKKMTNNKSSDKCYAGVKYMSCSS